ncbi:ShlB/FhaC/HecB family hemolysin secretion/activation protein, partial [Salmonella enterica subsp. enterica serovar Ajiobo]|nr:ShlB/FhaC/HecB family hemolysin secretion/activation protein [Salmonella enterica subsp. enterica serovar Ajiobo]
MTKLLTLFRCILLSGLFFCPPLSAAPFPAAAENPGADASRRAMQDAGQQVSDLLEQQTYRQLSKPQTTITPAEPLLRAAENEHCLPVSGVYLSGITLLSQDDLRSLSPLPADCIRSRDINVLVAELMERYLEKGYITARIRFLPVNSYHELGIGVTEGTVEQIDGADSGINTSLLFPSLTGKPLKITELEQGLDQANRLKSNHVTMDILPGSEPGGSVIRLVNQRGTPAGFSLSADNYGQKSTGRNVIRAAVTADSPAGLSDFVSLSGSATTDNPAARY